MARRRRPEARETSWWSQQSDVVKGGIIGVVGIIITAIVAPILLPIVGTIITPPTATPIVPTSTATQPPLGQPGLYLTRTINPPISLGAGESVLTSVWIQSVGGKSYTIDSIADLGDAMCLMSSGSGFSGAVLPSAIYKYDLGELRHILTPLSPSLQLSPLDPTELSFTLGLAFSADGNCSADPLIELGYHDSAGNDGTLLLVETRPDINFLSTLLDENLLVTTPPNPIINPALYIITPKGLQIGKDASVKAITYLPLSLPYVTSDVLMADSTTNIKINNINERAPINTIIDKKQLVDSIVAAVNRGETIAFDLCAGLTDPKCEQALMDAVEKDNLIELSLRSLTIHHLIYPDESLSNVITQHFSNITAFFKSKIADYDDYQASSLLYEMAIALSAKKIGNWTNPLIELARLEQTGYYREVCSVLLVVNSSLSKTQSEQLEKICVPKT